MLPRIRRAKDWESKFGKWMVYNSKHGDLVESLGDAIRYWFWYLGVNPRIAFLTFERWKKLKKDEQDL